MMRRHELIHGDRSVDARERYAAALRQRLKQSEMHCQRLRSQKQHLADELDAHRPLPLALQRWRRQQLADELWKRMNGTLAVATSSTTASASASLSGASTPNCTPTPRRGCSSVAKAAASTSTSAPCMPYAVAGRHEPKPDALELPAAARPGGSSPRPRVEPGLLMAKPHTTSAPGTVTRQTSKPSLATAPTDSPPRQRRQSLPSKGAAPKKVGLALGSPMVPQRAPATTPGKVPSGNVGTLPWNSGPGRALAATSVPGLKKAVGPVPYHRAAAAVDAGSPRKQPMRCTSEMAPESPKSVLCAN